MNIVIFTIGQRDVQLHIPNEDKYDSFEKSELKQVQQILKDKLESGQLVWKPIEGMEGRQELKSEIFQSFESDAKPELCFPFLEKFLNAFIDEQNNKTGLISIEKIIFLYTDRQHSNIKNFHIDNEPWFFVDLIEKFWSNIVKHYKIENIEFEKFNVCGSMNVNFNIDADFSYKVMDDFAKNLKNKYEDKDKDVKIAVANVAGIPRISQALELCLIAYFPKQIIFLEQSRNQISKSRLHFIRRKYALKFSILQNLKIFDFVAAFKDAQELQLKKIDKLLFYLLGLCKCWLYEEAANAETMITNILKFETLDQDLQKVIILMSKMLKPENNLGCNLIRTIQEARKNNLWSTTTLLISTAELFIIEKIQELFPKAVYRSDKKILFMVEKFPFKIKVPAKRYDHIIYKNLRDRYLANWETFDYILQSAKQSAYNNQVQELENFRKKIVKIKDNRNDFIHQGRTIPQTLYNSVLEIDKSKQLDEKNLNSKTFQYLLTEIERMKSIDFINWIPIIQKELIKRIEKMSPL